MPGPALYASLQETLVLCQSLTSLALTNLFMPMTDADGAVLCKGISKSRTLKSLDLSGNLLGKLTCWELKISLQKNKSLETLNMECNQVQVCVSVCLCLIVRVCTHACVYACVWGGIKSTTPGRCAHTRVCTHLRLSFPSPFFFLFCAGQTRILKSPTHRAVRHTSIAWDISE